MRLERAKRWREILKGTWGQNSPLFLWHNFNDFMEKESLYKVLRSFDQFSKSYEITKFWIQREWHHTCECTKHFILGFLCIFLLILWKENLLFYGHFDHFSWNYEVAKFWMIKLFLKVCDVIQTNEHTIWLTRKLLAFFVDAILFFDEKGSF